MPAGSWIDISISVVANLLTLALAYLGYRLTIHPVKKGDASRKRTFEICFITISLLSVVAGVISTWRNIQSANSHGDTDVVIENHAQETIGMCLFLEGSSPSTSTPIRKITLHTD